MLAVTGSGMKLRVNGREEIFETDRVTVGEYLASKGIRPETVAVEVNLTVLDKVRYAETFLRDGDEVEIVRFVGGGAA